MFELIFRIIRKSGALIKNIIWKKFREKMEIHQTEDQASEW